VTEHPRDSAALQFPSPKIGNKDSVDSWYRYYAGYSSQFVEYALANAAPRARNVLDPWNGTGTTTVVAAGESLDSYGYDINPAAVIVARARLLDNSVLGSIQALSADIAEHAKPVRLHDEPLHFWFSKDSSAQIRAIEVSICRLLVDSSYTNANPAQTSGSLSSLAAFFHVALFRTVRVLLAPATGSNPTWWKIRQGDDILRVPKQVVLDTFANCAAELGHGLHRQRKGTAPATNINVGDSRGLPLGDNTIDAVVTSPPYCTRIDYGISMRPELAVLRYTEQQLRDLRHLMVGTPTMTGEDADIEAGWGPTAATFLKAVAEHPSRASKTYYRRYFNQYYRSMHKSLTELRRVTTDGAPVILVVQDSHYKEVHNDTPQILREMAGDIGFAHAERHDFHIPRTKGAINPRTRVYRTVASATESVLLLR
jgi:DNA modification methylase